MNSPSGHLRLGWLGFVLLISGGRVFADEAERASLRVETLAAGVRIGADAPHGWTDLIVKSVPCLKSGDLGTLPRPARETAATFRTVLVADIRRVGPNSPYRLRRVGRALCVPYRGTDTTVTPGDNGETRASLSFLERQVLPQAAVELEKGRIVASTPTFAIYAGPTTQLLAGVHREVTLFYAMLVEPETGRLTTVVWSLPANGLSTVTTVLMRLPPGLTYECGIDVAAKRLVGTVPVGWSFAMREIPPGKPLVASEGVKDIVTQPVRIEKDPADFEKHLRAALVN